jgi:hypothetical protein
MTMADLTTVDGFRYSFMPGAVVAVTDREVGTGAAVTCVYGITPTPLRIAETVDGFLARIGVSAGFVRLTRADGSPIWVCAAAVSSLRGSLPDEYADSVRAVITAGGLTQGVEEDPDAVKAAIDARGGKL